MPTALTADSKFPFSAIVFLSVCWANKQGGVKTKRLALLISPLQDTSSAAAGLGDGFGLAKLKDLKAGVNRGVGVALKVQSAAGFRVL